MKKNLVSLKCKRSLEVDENRPLWTLVTTVAMVSASSPVFCYISKIRPRYVVILVIYLPQPREKHWKKGRSSKNMGIWNKNLTDSRVTLQEVVGYRVVPLIDSYFLGLTQKHSHCEPMTLHLSCLISILKDILKLDLFLYTSTSSLLFF